MNWLASLQGKNYGLTATMSSEPWWGGGCCWVITYINAPTATDIMTSHIVCVPSTNHNNILECPQRRTGMKVHQGEKSVCDCFFSMVK